MNQQYIVMAINGHIDNDKYWIILIENMPDGGIREIECLGVVQGKENAMERANLYNRGLVNKIN